MIDEYTRLLEAAAELGDERKAADAVAKLIAHLKSSGRIKMLPQIATELRKVAARRKAMQPVVEVAHAGESTKALAEAAALGIKAEHAHVNPSLIKGWRAKDGNRVIDRSGKGALVDIYKRVTA